MNKVYQLEQEKELQYKLKRDRIFKNNVNNISVSPLIVGFSESLQNVKFEGVPDELNIKLQEFPIMQQLTQRGININQLLDESMQRMNAIDPKSKLLDQNGTVEEKIAQIIKSRQNPMLRKLKDIFKVGEHVTPTKLRHQFTQQSDLSIFSDDEIFSMLNDAIHSWEETKKSANRLYEIINEEHNKSPKTVKPSTFSKHEPKVQLTQNQVTSKMTGLIGNPLTRNMKQPQSPFKSKQNTFGNAHPTEALVQKHTQLMKSYKFAKSVDNESEDDYSDDEERMNLKMKKVRERVRRADIVTEDTAIFQLVNHVESVKQSVKARSLIDHGINLSALKQKQNQLRQQIDEMDFQNTTYNEHSVPKNLDEDKIFSPKPLSKNEEAKLQAEYTHFLYEQSLRRTKASFLGNQVEVIKRREDLERRLSEFNKHKHTLGNMINEGFFEKSLQKKYKVPNSHAPLNETLFATSHTRKQLRAPSHVKGNPANSKYSIKLKISELEKESVLQKTLQTELFREIDVSVGGSLIKSMKSTQKDDDLLGSIISGPNEKQVQADISSTKAKKQIKLNRKNSQLTNEQLGLTQKMSSLGFESERSFTPPKISPNHQKQVNNQDQDQEQKVVSKKHSSPQKKITTQNVQTEADLTTNHNFLLPTPSLVQPTDTRQKVNKQVLQIIQQQMQNSKYDSTVSRNSLDVDIGPNQLEVRLTSVLPEIHNNRNYHNKTEMYATIPKYQPQLPVSTRAGHSLSKLQNHLQTATLQHYMNNHKQKVKRNAVQQKYGSMIEPQSYRVQMFEREIQRKAAGSQLAHAKNPLLELNDDLLGVKFPEKSFFIETGTINNESIYNDVPGEELRRKSFIKIDKLCDSPTQDHLNICETQVSLTRRGYDISKFKQELSMAQIQVGTNEVPPQTYGSFPSALNNLHQRRRQSKQEESQIGKKSPSFSDPIIETVIANNLRKVQGISGQTQMQAGRKQQFNQKLKSPNQESLENLKRVPLNQSFQGLQQQLKLKHRGHLGELSISNYHSKTHKISNPNKKDIGNQTVTQPNRIVLQTIQENVKLNQDLDLSSVNKTTLLSHIMELEYPDLLPESRKSNTIIEQ